MILEILDDLVNFDDFGLLNDFGWLWMVLNGWRWSQWFGMILMVWMSCMFRDYFNGPWWVCIILRDFWWVWWFGKISDMFEWCGMLLMIWWSWWISWLVSCCFDIFLDGFENLNEFDDDSHGCWWWVLCLWWCWKLLMILMSLITFFIVISMMLMMLMFLMVSDVCFFFGCLFMVFDDFEWFGTMLDGFGRL